MALPKFKILKSIEKTAVKIKDAEIILRLDLDRPFSLHPYEATITLITFKPSFKLIKRETKHFKTRDGALAWLDSMLTNYERNADTWLNEQDTDDLPVITTF